ADPSAQPARAGTPARGTTTAAATSATTPLSVTLTSLTPAAVPRSGVITLSGRVTNVSSDAWSDVTLSPFVSADPITTRDELALAAATQPSATVGDRLVGEAVTGSAGDLAPGATRTFTLRVPRAKVPISGAPGVYWIGVHALGSGPQGRDLVADGRARTFIPLVGPEVQRTRTVPVRVLVPLRERARRAADGSLNGITRWSDLVSSEGRLSRLGDLASTAPSGSLTWVVDPAVLDALEDVGRGNPPLALGPERAGPSASASPTPGGDASTDPSSDSTTGTGATPAGGAPDGTTRGRASSLVRELVTAIGSQDTLALGYADPDVAALLRTSPGLLDRAQAATRRRLDARGLRGDPVVVPPEEVVDPTLVSRLSRATTLVLGDQGSLTSPTASRLPTGQELVLGDDRASAGGPAPGSPLTALALRQRVLSEAALEAEKGDQDPRAVTVLLPPRWDPGTDWRDADLFRGLQTPWTRLEGVPRDPTTSYAGTLAYPVGSRALEVPAANVRAARTLTLTGFTLGHLLASRNDVTERLVGAALQAASYSARPTAGLAAQQVLDLDAATRRQMGRVQVTGTDFVTLSGGSGTVTVSIVNGLRQPITVGLRARADSSDVQVADPPVVSMQPGQRTTLRLDVTSRAGVHDVTIDPVTTRGEVLGTPLTFSLRTSQVGRAVWFVIVAGGVLLAVMILRRIVLRVRDHRWRTREQQ
ncbi:MAG: hypothetical protein JWR42_873, partial [Marmoricola sp.]|nr:hypothetical protein [Marmoricola sp.]